MSLKSLTCWLVNGNTSVSSCSSSHAQMWNQKPSLVVTVSHVQQSLWQKTLRDAHSQTWTLQECKTECRSSGNRKRLPSSPFRFCSPPSPALPSPPPLFLPPSLPSPAPRYSNELGRPTCRVQLSLGSGCFPLGVFREHRTPMCAVPAGCWNRAVRLTRSHHVQPNPRPVLLVSVRTLLQEALALHGPARVSDLRDEQAAAGAHRGEASGDSRRAVRVYFTVPVSA